MIGMDMGRILTIFNSMKNVNMSGTPATKDEPVEEEVAEVKSISECSNCQGLGQLDLGWGETIPCFECRSSGKIFEYSDGVDSGNIGDSGAEDEGPQGKYGAGQMWQRDEMDIPPIHSFKDEFAGEKFSDQAVNDHDLTVDDQLEQEGLEEDYKFTPREISMKRSQMEHEINWCQNAIKKLEELLVRKPSKIKEINTLKRQIREKELKLAFDPTYGGEVKELPIERQYMDGLEESINEGSQKCVRCGVETVAPGIKFCDDCYKTAHEAAMDRANAPNLKRRSTDVKESKSPQEMIREQMEQLNIIMEVAPDDQEEWVRKNKARFIKEYGKEKGLSVLYSLAWKRHKGK